MTVASSSPSVEPPGPSSHDGVDDRIRLHPIVNQLLGIVQEDPQIKRTVRNFVLTRDVELDRRQHDRFVDAVTPRLGQLPAMSRLPHSDLHNVLSFAYDELLGISVVGPFWRDDSISEILIDSWDSITVERRGQLIRTPVRFHSPEHARMVARNLALVTSDRALSPTEPAITAEVAGARVAFTIDKIVKSGLAVAIRKFSSLMSMDGLLSVGALSGEMRDFLDAAVAARANVLVSGGTGAGKTTMVNALSESIPSTERVVTIEDAFELQLKVQHWVQLQTKEAASGDDEVRVSLADLLVHTLRMRPDRIIVGEIREASAAAVMLQAANTGHDGTMTTIHAQTADRALNFRLAGMARTGGQLSQDVAAREVASAIDVVVQVVRRRGRRFVSTIDVVDVDDVDGARIEPIRLFEASHRGDEVEFIRCGDVPAGSTLAEKLEDVGRADGWVVETMPVAGQPHPARGLAGGLDDLFEDT